MDIDYSSWSIKRKDFLKQIGKQVQSVRDFVNFTIEKITERPTNNSLLLPTLESIVFGGRYWIASVVIGTLIKQSTSMEKNWTGMTLIQVTLMIFADEPRTYSTRIQINRVLLSQWNVTRSSKMTFCIDAVKNLFSYWSSLDFPENNSLHFCTKIKEVTHRKTVTLSLVHSNVQNLSIIDPSVNRAPVKDMNAWARYIHICSIPLTSIKAMKTAVAIPDTSALHTSHFRNHQIVKLHLHIITNSSSFSSKSLPPQPILWP